MSKAGRKIAILSSIRIGDPITADYLNAITELLNSPVRAVAGARSPSTFGSSDSGTSLDLNFIESSRVETETTFTDDNGDDVIVNVFDEVTFVNSTGDILKLTFDNPE